jgi:hypothetical protein
MLINLGLHKLLPKLTDGLVGPLYQPVANAIAQILVGQASCLSFLDSLAACPTVLAA